MLRDGLIAERHSYFDPLPVALKLLRSPRLLWAAHTGGAGELGRARRLA